MNVCISACSYMYMYVSYECACVHVQYMDICVIVLCYSVMCVYE